MNLLNGSKKMARPSKNNAEYFPHKTNMINHRKVVMLRTKFGSLMGYAFWCLILEWLTDRDGLEWEDSEIELEMFANTLGISSIQVRELIDFCFKIQLLFKTESGFIYSETLNENLEPVFEKRNKEREKSKLRKRTEDGKFQSNHQVEGVSDAETTVTMVISEIDLPHSKLEYSIVEESKVNNKRKNFIAPNLNEIELFFIDKYKSTEIAAKEFSLKFHSYYSSNGWKVGGKAKMADWKAAITGTWSNTAKELCLKYPIPNQQPEFKRRTLNDKFSTV